MIWSFCLRSLVREYGWRFVRDVAVRHPRRTLRALREASRLDVTGGGVDVASGLTADPAGVPPSIIGAGFCLKPVEPACPSGRANHECACLDGTAEPGEAAVSPPCRACAIRVIGTGALRAGSAFYVMTSAQDILDDVFLPAMSGRTFTTGLFVLCRYSFQPFALGLLASGMSGRLLPLEQGDCRDYATWLLADRGVKNEQTAVRSAALADVMNALDPMQPAARRFERRGHVLFPAGDRPAA